MKLRWTHKEHLKKLVTKFRCIDLISHCRKSHDFDGKFKHVGLDRYVNRQYSIIDLYYGIHSFDSIYTSIPENATSESMHLVIGIPIKIASPRRIWPRLTKIITLQLGVREKTLTMPRRGKWTRDRIHKINDNDGMDSCFLTFSNLFAISMT